VKGFGLGELEQLITIHGRLLDDRVRNRAFHAALAARVTPGCSVLDVGAGSGIWAIAAARLGAKRVVAIEKDPALLPLIDALARENGVADRIEILNADARKLRLARAFDVVVSETVGNLGFDESIIEILALVRRRFLRPGGIVIPQHLALKAAPIRESAAGPGRVLKRRVFDALAIQFPRSPRGRLRPLAPAAELLQVDLTRASAPPSLSGLAARWPIERPRTVDGIAVWVGLTLAPGVTLETFSSTHWSPLVFGLERLPNEPGTLSFHLELTPEPPRWEVALESRGRRTARSYSPLFAYGWVKPRLRGRTPS
jgi:SAM-dependent methyltransferase